MEDLEDLSQLLVVLVDPSSHFALKIVQALLKCRKGVGDTAQLDKCPHDLDVDRDGAVAAKDTGEHCYALLGEDVRRVASSASAVV